MSQILAKSKLKSKKQSKKQSKPDAVCASCLHFKIDAIVKSVEEKKPMWLHEVDYVREFIATQHKLVTKRPCNYNFVIDVTVGKRHVGKFILYWGTNSSTSPFHIKGARQAYGKFSNHGISKVNSSGVAKVYFRCPQVYRVQASAASPCRSYFKHMHFVLSNRACTSWDPQLYTRIVSCSYSLDQTLTTHSKGHCVLWTLYRILRTQWTTYLARIIYHTRAYPVCLSKTYFAGYVSW